MREFKLNYYITLKLENNKTFIYVAGEEFSQCHYLLLNKKVDEIKDLKLIESIDQLEAQLDKTMERSNVRQLKILPETEFWAHCSNMQIWAENQYDTKMLHRNLAFPLLKKLTEAGDMIAKKVFKEEIVERFESGFEPVVKFLILEGYMDHFSQDELDIIGENSKNVRRLDFSRWHFEGDSFPQILPYLVNLQELSMNYCHLSRLPQSFSNLKSLQTLSLGYNRFDEIPDSIIKLPKLETLQMVNNGLKKVSDNIQELKYLRGLSLHKNRLRSLPNSISQIPSLNNLALDGNQFKIFPEQLTMLAHLESLGLNSNQLTEIPDSIKNLKTLRIIGLDKNKLKSLPDSIGYLRSLEYLWLDNNQIQTLPESIYYLKSLKFITIRNNPLKNALRIKKRFLDLGIEFR